MRQPARAPGFPAGNRTAPSIAYPSAAGDQADQQGYDLARDRTQGHGGDRLGGGSLPFRSHDLFEADVVLP